jgi:hypothetical protein
MNRIWRYHRGQEIEHVTTTAADRASTATDVSPVREISHEEGLAMLDRRARRRLGFSGAEFLRRWEAGAYADDPDQPGVMDVALLLPFVGRAPHPTQPPRSGRTTGERCPCAAYRNAESASGLAARCVL